MYTDIVYFRKSCNEQFCSEFKDEFWNVSFQIVNKNSSDWSSHIWKKFKWKFAAIQVMHFWSFNFDYNFIVRQAISFLLRINYFYYKFGLLVFTILGQIKFYFRIVILVCLKNKCFYVLFLVHYFVFMGKNFLNPYLFFNGIIYTSIAIFKIQMYVLYKYI